MAAVAPDEPRLADADLVWLTPGFKTHGVLREWSGAATVIVVSERTIRITRDVRCGGRARGSKVMLMPGLDHGLEKPGHVAGSWRARK